MNLSTAARDRLVLGRGVALIAVIVSAAVVIVLHVSNGNVVIGLGAVTAVGTLVWLCIPSRRADRTPKLLSLAVVAFVFSTLLPAAIAAILQMLALVAGYLWWLSRKDQRGGAAVAWSAVIIGVWVALMLHPNVPGFDVALLGVRKTALCVAGVALGAAVPRRLRGAVEMTFIRALWLAVAVSVVVHLFIPTLEQSISRGAGEYTGMIGGVARLQGIFPGPFHAALAAVCLALWALVRWRTRRGWAVIVLATSLVALQLTLVRTGYAALLVGIAAIVLCSPSTSQLLKRFTLALFAGVVAVVFLANFNPASLDTFSTIVNFSSDSRFMNRLPGYAHGIALVQESPLIGWGAGSAGDTLGDEFAGRQFVTSHNILLKILVEGGILGLVPWIGLTIAAARAIQWKSPDGATAVAMVAALGTFGLTVASLEALPVSYIIFVFVGLALRGKRGDLEDGPDTRTLAIADDAQAPPVARKRLRGGPVRERVGPVRDDRNGVIDGRLPEHDKFARSERRTRR